MGESAASHNDGSHCPKDDRRQLKVIVSAYACSPGKGSEPGVGWNFATELAKHHQVWLLTRANNRHSIDEALASDPTIRLSPIYFDLPRWLMWWKRGPRGFRLYYYLWQLGVYFLARRLHRRIGFDLAHHVTFVKYCSPSFISLLPIPFVWGPVGGGEQAPLPFIRDLSIRGQGYELARSIARLIGEIDPFVRLTARRSSIAFATTEDTAHRLRALGARTVVRRSEAGLSATDVLSFARAEQPPDHPFRFVSMGRLLPLKAFHLGLRAFAAAGAPGEFVVVGDGRDRARLERLCRETGIVDRVRFTGHLSRSEALEMLAASHVLVHPSLHESGGWVCLEAMGMGKPVVCLNLGGPAQQVTADCGFVVRAKHPEDSIAELSQAMTRLSADRALYARMAVAGRERVRDYYWDAKVEAMTSSYEHVLSARAGPRAAAFGDR